MEAIKMGDRRKRWMGSESHLEFSSRLITTKQKRSPKPTNRLDAFPSALHVGYIPQGSSLTQYTKTTQRAIATESRSASPNKRITSTPSCEMLSSSVIPLPHWKKWPTGIGNRSYPTEKWEWKDWWECQKCCRAEKGWTTMVLQHLQLVQQDIPRINQYSMNIKLIMISCSEIFQFLLKRTNENLMVY